MGDTNSDKFRTLIAIIDDINTETDFVNDINTAILQNIGSVLDKYSQNFGYDIKSYTALTVDGKNKLSQDFSDKEFSNADEIVEFYNKKTDEYKDTGSSGIPKGGSTGGSSGGRKNTVSGNTSDVAIITPGTNSEETFYNDMQDYSWANVAVNTLTRRKIVNGAADGVFNPSGRVTREEFVKMLVLATQKYDITAKCNFADVPEDAWYYTYVASAKNANMINGVSEDIFGSGEPITRQDMAVMLYNFMKPSDDADETVGYSDGVDIAGYALKAVAYLSENSYLYGTDDNRFMPAAFSTRAEAAVLIYRLLTL